MTILAGSQPASMSLVGDKSDSSPIGLIVGVAVGIVCVLVVCVVVGLNVWKRKTDGERDSGMDSFNSFSSQANTLEINKVEMESLDTIDTQSSMNSARDNYAKLPSSAGDYTVLPGTSDSANSGSGYSDINLGPPPSVPGNNYTVVPSLSGSNAGSEHGCQ